MWIEVPHREQNRRGRHEVPDDSGSRSDNCSTMVDLPLHVINTTSEQMGNSTPHEALKTYWGYEDFLPHQEEVIEHIQTGRDSLTVLPTGGGKSLCFQVPAVCGEGLVVVVSPLVALMKDQVDGLRECGIAAAAIHSGLSFETKRKIFEELRRDELKLIYLAPESLLKPQFLDFLCEVEAPIFCRR